MTYILAHDLGTTGNKATLFDAETGVPAASAFEAYHTAYPQPNWAERIRRLAPRRDPGHAASVAQVADRAAHGPATSRSSASAA